MINLIFLMIALPSLLLILFLAFINITLGFSNLVVLVKAYSKRSKNFMIVNRYGVDLKTKYYLGERLANQVKFKDDSSLDCKNTVSTEGFYRLFGKLDCCDYFENDINPRSPRNHNMVSIHPLEHAKALKIAVKSEVDSQGETWLKKNWKYLGLGVLILVGILGFVIINQAATIQDMAIKYISTTVVQGA